MNLFLRYVLLIVLVVGLSFSGLGINNPLIDRRTVAMNSEAIAVEIISDIIETKEIKLADGAIAVEVPGNWRPNPKQNSFRKDNVFDKDYIARRDFLGSAMRAVRFDELPVGLMPKDIYLQEIESITESLQGSAELVELEAIETLPDKRITSSTYVIKVGGLMSFHYKIALIEFTEDSDYFLVMVQGGAPKNWDTANEKLQEINRSATLLAAKSFNN
ncbi:hypothetical protein Lepto7376_1874 [[Leptolyngbya] sp. PCC 7376]|uniref:hypothetical protein n=1 Tax=[Leptolyngbya] sp. PCC 7376 TaxID=111781 RepID=UPI00029EC92D|nr:hypothetical protein [[Leptolyngbya] sp. PCC 7376]AFY38194.1 hypothetical protein Lepto7376_1874 [[Leptolyngbya] sp. PCC 7376]